MPPRRRRARGRTPRAPTSRCASVVGVALLEAGLGQLVHHRRLGERLGQPDRLGVLRRDIGDQPLPEGDRLRVGVVDAEDAHAVVEPHLDDPAHLGVRPGGVVVEVERVDVLVLLRRVLGVGDGAVGPCREERGVRLHPRVVGGGLQRDVERHLEPGAACLGDEVVEVLEGAEVGVDRVVPAVGRADGVRGCRGRRGRRRGCCCGPCGRSCRSGGSASGRRRRNPCRRWRAAAGRGPERAGDPRAGLLVAVAPSDRGKISYQAP